MVESADALGDDFDWAGILEESQSDTGGDLELQISQAETNERSLDSLANAPISRRMKRKVKAKEAKKRKKAKFGDDEAVDLSSSVAMAPPDIQADHLSEKQTKVFANLSALERDDFRLPEFFFQDVSSFGLDQRKTLSGLLSAVSLDLANTLGKPSKVSGSPRVIVLAGAALRVIDICRDLKTLTKGGEVAKLFAKHFKLADQLKHCSKACFGVAVGTPDRVGKLLEASVALNSDKANGSVEIKSSKSRSSIGLSITSTAFLVLDVSYRDTKNRSMLDLPEARDALFRLVLNRSDIMNRFKSRRMKLLLY